MEMATVDTRAVLLQPVRAAESDEDRLAIRFPEGAVSYRELRRRALATAAQLETEEQRIAVWAEPKLSTCIAVVACLLTGRTVVPLNPKLGPRELGHIVADSRPALLFADPELELPPELAGLPRRAAASAGGTDEGEATPGERAATEDFPPEPDPELPALIIYTSGTTGPPKGVLLPRRAVVSNLRALADAWQWTATDVLIHGLPLFHAHGLILGTLGPLQLGGTVHHVGRFTPEAVAAELRGRGTMLFAVPTMYHRLAEAAEADPEIAAAIASARLLVSGSAPLAGSDYERILRATGQRIIERYGLTETIMNTAARADGPRQPGSVGPPLPGTAIRLLDEDGSEIDPADTESIGEVYVQGPNLFTGYLNRPDATAEAMVDGWFRTGDVAHWLPGGELRIVGRMSTDLIKTGGYKVGAGEVEAVIAEWPGVVEVAVVGEADEDLGERIVAYVVLEAGAELDEQALIDDVAAQLAPHKRPRQIHLLDELPRNALGKVMKRQLAAAAPPDQ
jgi:malonyl-CoA/methylmalonyl-CoA synthetase